MKNAIARLTAGATSEAEVIDIITGGEPLTERETALLEALDTFRKQEKASATVNQDGLPKFNHGEKGLFEAVGIPNDTMVHNLKKMTAWVATYSIMEERPPSQSRVIEQIYNNANTELERIVLARLVKI